MTIIANNSRADYMKIRRKDKKTFSALIEKEKIDRLTEKLNQQNKSKTLWLEEKIDEELQKK